MATVETNKEWWESAESWQIHEEGESWSDAWGSTDFLWHCTLLPRLQAFLPARRALEIAPGFGRITRFLKDYCEHLAIVDLSNRCIESCRKRFSGLDYIEYFVNDGRSLGMVADNSIDLIFSYDSLVHCDRDVIQSYVSEAARKLSEHGVMFFHHSNLFEYVNRGLQFLPDQVLQKENVNPGFRSPTVSAELVRSMAQSVGLTAIVQEIFPWGGASCFGAPLDIDTISILTRPASMFAGETKVFRNPEFQGREASHAKLLSGFYPPKSKFQR